MVYVNTVSLWPYSPEMVYVSVAGVTNAVEGAETGVVVGVTRISVVSVSRVNWPGPMGKDSVMVSSETRTVSTLPEGEAVGNTVTTVNPSASAEDTPVDVGAGTVKTTGAPYSGVTVTVMAPLPGPLGVGNGITSVTVVTPDEMVAVLTGIVTKKGEPEAGVTVKTKPLAVLSELEDGGTVTVKTPPGWSVGELAGPLEPGRVTTKGEPEAGVTVTTRPLAVSEAEDGGTVTVTTPPNWSVGELAGLLESGTVTTKGDPEDGVTVKTKPLAVVCEADGGTVTVKTPPDWPVGELAGPLDPGTVTTKGEPEVGVMVKTNGADDANAGAVV